MASQKSTIDRIRAVEAPGIPGPAGVRRALQLLERLSPALGGYLAERMWFRRPPVPPATRRARRTPGGGEPFRVAWSGGTVAGRAYGVAGAPTAYLVHGWGGWWQQLGAHVEPLLAAGMQVVAFDAPSHGESGPGRFGRHSTTLIEFAEALAAVVAEFGHPAAVIAHSAGAVGVLHAYDRGVQADAYALVAPPDSMAPMMRRFCSVLGVGPRSGRRMLERAERRIGLPLERFDMVRMARTLPAHPPLLVVHDRHDPETPATGSVALAAAWPGADLLLTEGLGHRRLLWEGTVVERVAGFVAATRRTRPTAAPEVSRSSR
ncbi:MAG TPA: alpha/beta fold hydrolase [Pedococcus sp.]|nr:alpha/beta fold hydrolase [Pedococcus sp.]